MSLVKKD